MRIGIVVDSTCDLPVDYLREHQVEILPISVRIGDELRVDYRDEAETLAYLRSHIAERGASAETIPFSVEQIRDLFLKKLVVDYDHVFCITVTSTRSPIFDHATQASYAILNEYRPIRAAAGHNTPFALRVVDTRNLFSAQGVLPVEAIRLRAAGDEPGRIRQRLEELAVQTWGYLVPRDLYYIRNRARHKGDRSVGLFSAALGTALDIKPVLACNRGETGPVAKIRGFDPAVRAMFEFAARRVEAGLLTPTVCLCYGGDLSEMRAMPGYESIMSLTGMVNVGSGAVCVGFAAPDHAFG
jgi:DegV family protein with EDD domain